MSQPQYDLRQLVPPFGVPPPGFPPPGRPPPLGKPGPIWILKFGDDGPDGVGLSESDGGRRVFVFFGFCDSDFTHLYEPLTTVPL